MGAIDIIYRKPVACPDCTHACHIMDIDYIQTCPECGNTPCGLEDAAKYETRIVELITELAGLAYCMSVCPFWIREKKVCKLAKCALPASQMENGDRYIQLAAKRLGKEV